MAIRGNWRILAGAGVLTAALAGCGDKGKPVVESKPEDKPPVASIGNGSTKPVEPGDANTGNDVKVELDPKLHMPFDKACTNEITADSPVTLPPDRTYTGKNCGMLNDSVSKLWNQIKFVSPDGKRQTYVVELEVTTGKDYLGTIELVMQPDLAPNHVRNFVALATLQYYDGLRFDRIVQQKFEGDAGQMGKLVLLEAGSPLETHEPERSHLGYWVRPEFSEGAKHEEGTVGACLVPCEGNEETAALRFYLNLTPAPAMDGNFTIFAKVSKGLEVARKISEQPIKNLDAGPEQGKPLQPITISKVTVRAVPVQ